MIGTWTDRGSSWTGSIPYNDAQWHYGPARLWTTPVNSDQYGNDLLAPTTKSQSFHPRYPKKLLKLYLSVSL